MPHLIEKCCSSIEFRIWNAFQARLNQDFFYTVEDVLAIVAWIPSLRQLGHHYLAVFYIYVRMEDSPIIVDLWRLIPIKFGIQLKEDNHPKFNICKHPNNRPDIYLHSNKSLLMLEELIDSKDGFRIIQIIPCPRQRISNFLLFFLPDHHLSLFFLN